MTVIKPDALWSGEPTATVTPALASPVAAELYRRALVIDGDVLGEIGFPISTDDPVGPVGMIVGSCGPLVTEPGTCPGRGCVIGARVPIIVLPLFSWLIECPW